MSVLQSTPEKDDAEEVFAESYDTADASSPSEEVDREEKYRGGAPGCPNKYNQYHLCSDFCFDHWQEGYPESRWGYLITQGNNNFRLPEKYLEARQLMLKNYPLPEGWKEIYDAGVRRHYYWCADTDEVCWLSPRHPRAEITEPAPKVAKGGWLKEEAVISRGSGIWSAPA